jgi:hypothetical protein
MENLYSDIAARLKEVLFFAKKLNLATSQQHFGELLGYNDKAYISSIFNGRKNPKDFILCIGDRFPHFNTEYIRTGKGKLIKEEYITSNRDSLLNNYLGNPSEDDTLFDTPDPKDETPQEEIPTAIPIIPPTIIDNPAISIRKDMQENISDYEIFDFEEIIKYIESGIRVRTEKLAPYINVGDIIFIKRLDNGQDIINGSPCLVDTSNLGGLIRYVFDEGEYLRLIATNRALDIIVPKAKVRSVWPIVGRYTPGISMPDYLANKQIEQQGKQITSLVDSVNNLVTATIDEGRRTDVVLSMLKDELNKNK